MAAIFSALREDLPSSAMKHSVLIVGSGIAGLTAALRLNEQGYAVTLLEHKSPGDLSTHRIGTLSDADVIPPVMMGWHRATQSLLQTIGTASRVRFLSRLSFEFSMCGRPPRRLSRPCAPAPFHTIVGLAFFRGLPLRDRWRFLLWLEQTWEKDPALPADLDAHTAEAWLRGIGQSEGARVQVWTPLCRFLQGDDLKTVSAAMFLNMLIQCFLSPRSHGRLAIPGDSVRRLLIEPALDLCNKSGVAIRSGVTVTQIQINRQGVTGIKLEDGSHLAADWYVLAIPHQGLSPLLPERAVTRFSYFQQLAQLTDTAALAVHLRLDYAGREPRVVLLAEGTYHWIVVRPDDESRRVVVSVVATGRPMLLDRSDEDLVDLALHDLWEACPSMRSIPVLGRHVVREPRAFLSVRPRSTALRPLQQSPFTNLFLAGAWTDTGLSSTLESAILSGDLCVQAIAAKRRTRR